jgi:hypothetical protein
MKERANRIAAFEILAKELRRKQVLFRNGSVKISSFRNGSVKVSHSFLFLSFSLGYFSPRRRYPMVPKI